MAKRGRKPKERKGYFYEKEEQAIVDYTTTRDIEEKNRIFNTILLPALTKMIESIIRRYKLFVPEEEFQQTFNDTISYLLTKINNFKPEMWVYAEISGETPEAPVEDQTAEGFEAKTCPKFEVFTDKAGKARFRLKARNGEIILASQGYASVQRCLAGVESVKKNAADSKVTEVA